MEVKFIIWGRNKAGYEFECFAWTRDAESGIVRAWSDAAKFGVVLSLVWAVPV